jgi:hypothetical protein
LESVAEGAFAVSYIPHEDVARFRDDAIAHLRGVNRAEELRYRGILVDDTWPADALVGMIYESTAQHVRLMRAFRSPFGEST